MICRGKPLDYFGLSFLLFDTYIFIYAHPKINGVFKPLGIVGVFKLPRIAGVFKPSGIAGLFKPPGIAGVFKLSGIARVFKSSRIAGGFKSPEIMTLDLSREKQTAGNALNEG